MKKGLIHIYTGNGKGKTTAAIGLGVRAAGRKNRVYMIQFLKSSFTGELESLKNLDPEFKVFRFEKNRDCFVWNMNKEQIDDLKCEIRNAFDAVKCFIINKECDLLILDEIFGAISNKFLSANEVYELLKNKPEELEIVLTGRNAPEEIKGIADYISEIVCEKHPFEKGIPAREGIEF